MRAERPARRSLTSAIVVLATLTALTVVPASGSDPEVVSRARALEADGRTGLAVSRLRETLAAPDASRDPRILLELARLTDDPDEALALADEVLARADGETAALAHALRGDYLYTAARYREAAQEYEAALRLGAGSGVALRLGASLLESGDVTRAIKAYDRTAMGASGDVAVLAEIGAGRARIAAGEAEVAAKALMELAERAPSPGLRADALAAASDARLALGDIAGANELLARLAIEAPETFQGTLAAARADRLERELAAVDSMTVSDADTLPETAAPEGRPRADGSAGGEDEAPETGRE